ncbi:MAG: hypothetical protein GQ570_08475 [Helicobacteraceae bacterium]|nr:hypothetical protein [Helicobacteraceae bacterium]
MDNISRLEHVIYLVKRYEEKLLSAKKARELASSLSASIYISGGVIDKTLKDIEITEVDLDSKANETLLRIKGILNGS